MNFVKVIASTPPAILSLGAVYLFVNNYQLEGSGCLIVALIMQLYYIYEN